MTRTFFFFLKIDRISFQKSTCSRHDAVNLADSKPNRGYAASGGGTVDCSRHDMKRPNSFGDLQVGER